MVEVNTQAARSRPETAAPAEATENKAQAKLDAFLAEQSQKLSIDELALNEAFVGQAVSYMAASVRYAKAAQVLKLVKIERDAVRAAKRQDVLASATDKKPTEGTIEALLSLDEEVQAVERKLAYADMQATQYQGVLRAWEHKRDMLIQLGSTQRAEFNAGISIREPKGPGTSGDIPRNPAPTVAEDEPVLPKPGRSARSGKSSPQKRNGKIERFSTDDDFGDAE